MATILESARVVSGSGRRRTVVLASLLFLAHAGHEHRKRPAPGARTVTLGSFADAEEQIEREGLAPYDRLMRQPPRPR